VVFELLNHNIDAKAICKDTLAGYFNFLIGNNFQKHVSNVCLTKEVVVKEIYKGIDIRYYFDEGFLRFDFIVSPNANPSLIRFKLTGQTNDYILDDNNLAFNTVFGDVKLKNLLSFQEKKKIKSKFVRNNDGYGFEIENYNTKKTLIIDPLVYSSFIGGSSSDWGLSIKTDGSGNAYIAGKTNSADYDITPGVFQSALAGNYDIFVSKFNSNGSNLIFSTYIGGSTHDHCNDIVVDSNGNSYITGYTNSTNFITTPGVYQTSNDGNNDVFVLKLNSSGTSVLFSTLLGGSAGDFGRSLALDENGNIYLTGLTQSLNFDITTGSYQNSNGDGGVYGDAFLTKLNPSGTNLIYSTYLGGNNHDEANDISIDTNGNAYLIGTTMSLDFDLGPNPYQSSIEGTQDVFVTKVNSTGNSIIYSTYLGGAGIETGYGIVIDQNNNAYLVGTTTSSDFDITASCYQSNYEGSTDLFITKLNHLGTGLIYSTYLGGSGNDTGFGIFLDNNNNAVVVGSTSSSNFDTTPNGFQTIYDGSQDAFVSMLNSTGSGLIYSTYIGGSNIENCFSGYIDANNYIYLTGGTSSTDFDITPGSFQTTNSSYSGFVSKLCPAGTMSVSLTSPLSTQVQTVCVNSTISSITYSTAFAMGINIVGLPPGVNPVFNSGTININGSPSTTGIFIYTVNIFGGCGNPIETGTITVNGCTGLIQPSPILKNTLYPNPSSGKFFIEISVDMDEVIEILDLTGKILDTKQISKGINTIYLNLQNGVYFIKHVQTGLIEKIIIEYQ
jgi:hypothetical protein